MEELTIWEKASGSNDVQRIEDYLRRYPNGSFSEIAQFELDRALARQGEKKIEILSAAANPYTKGSEDANTAYQVGDTYRYRELDPDSKMEKRSFVRNVTRVTQEDVVFDDGWVLDLLGNIKRFPDGRIVKGNQSNPLEYSVGKRWSYHPVITYPNGYEAPADAEGTIADRQDVVVPAGTFKAFRVVLRTVTRNFDGQPVEVRTTMWMAPAQVRALILREEFRYVRGTRVFALRTELVSFKQR